MDRSALVLLAYKTNAGRTTGPVVVRALELVDEFLALHSESCPVASVPWFVPVLAKLPADPEGAAVALDVLSKYVRDRDHLAAVMLHQIACVARVLMYSEREIRAATRPRRTDAQRKRLDEELKQIFTKRLEWRTGYGSTVQESKLRGVLL
jgi:hypothetical protein